MIYTIQFYPSGNPWRIIDKQGYIVAVYIGEKCFRLPKIKLLK